MFTRVSTQVTTLSQHTLPAVQKQHGVERSAFECIMEERNYVVAQKEETHQKAKAKVAELMVTWTRWTGGPPVQGHCLETKSKDVRKISQQWAELYEKGVGAFQSNITATTELAAKARSSAPRRTTYMAAKNYGYSDAKNALAIVNRINALAFETRMNEKAYMPL